MAILQERARAAIKQHGGLRKAARALGINHSTLLFLSDGRRTAANPKTLRAFGLKGRKRFQVYDAQMDDKSAG